MKTNIYFKRYIRSDPFQRKDLYFYSSGAKSWFLNGKLHREDGPASERSNGAKHWWLNNNNFSEKNYWKAIEKYKKKNKTNK